jgi:hypothetical protein
MQFEDGDDDNTLARAKVDPNEVSLLINYLNYQ